MLDCCGTRSCSPDIAPTGLCYFDKELRFLRVNDWLAGPYGIPVEEHLGRTLADVPPEVAMGNPAARSDRAGSEDVSPA